MWKPSETHYKRVVAECRLLLPVPQFVKTNTHAVFSQMRKDEVYRAIINYQVISQLAHKLTLKHYHELDRHEHIRCKVREMGCLLVDLKQEHKIQSTADALHPLNFDAVVSSVRHVAGFTEDSHSHHLHLNLVICLKSVQVCRLPKPCVMAVMRCKKC